MSATSFVAQESYSVPSRIWQDRRPQYCRKVAPPWMPPPAPTSRVCSVSGAEACARNNMIFAAIAGGIGLVAVVVADDDTTMWIVGWGLIAFGVGLFGWELSKSTQKQKPLLVLTPDALFMRVEGATEFGDPVERGPWRRPHRHRRPARRSPQERDCGDGRPRLLRARHPRRIRSSAAGRAGARSSSPLATTACRSRCTTPSCPSRRIQLLAVVEARYRAFGAPPQP